MREYTLVYTEVSIISRGGVICDAALRGLHKRTSLGLFDDAWDAIATTQSRVTGYGSGGYFQGEL